MNQRLIKFRAWDKIRKMSKPITLQELGKNEYDPTSWIDEAIWLQFTGLKDKNGKEIYEGDILEIRYNNKTSLRHFVEWNDKKCGWSDYEPKEKFEVIGNIYESKLTN